MHRHRVLLHLLLPCACRRACVCRLHEVALGMDYLHSRGIMHSDLRCGCHSPGCCRAPGGAAQPGRHIASCTATAGCSLLDTSAHHELA